MTDITKMSLVELHKRQTDTAEMKKLVAEDEKVVQAELQRRFESAHLAGLKALGKSAGTITSVQPGGMRLNADTPKGNVVWDQTKLWAFAETQSRENLEALCKIELTPKEPVYKSLLPSSNIKPMLDEARTDHAPGTTKFKLLAEGEK